MSKKIKPKYKNIKNFKDGYYWADVLYSDGKRKGKEIIFLEVFQDDFYMQAIGDNEYLDTKHTGAGMSVRYIYTKRIKFKGFK